MINSMYPSQANFVVDLDIGGLPELSGTMMGGGLYALKAATPSARFPLLIGSLFSALASGLTCSVIVPSKPELFVQRIQMFGNIDAAQLIEAGRLHIFVMQAEFGKAVFRNGADGFVQELEQFAVPENSYLIFDQADELLSLHDISLALHQVDTLGKWFGQRGVTGLLVFSRATDEHVSTINALMDHFSGVARLGGGQQGLEITFDYWQSPVGTLVSRTYRLDVHESGYYEVSTQIAPQNADLEQAAGERLDDRRATDTPSTRRENIQSELTTLLSASDGDALPDFSSLRIAPPQPESITASVAEVPAVAAPVLPSNPPMDSRATPVQPPQVLPLPSLTPGQTPAPANAAKPVDPATDVHVFHYSASVNTPAIGTREVRRATRSSTC